MNDTLIKAVYVVLASMGLALVFNFLFFGVLIGISVFIFVTVLLGAVFLLGHRQLSLKKAWWLIALIGFFSIMLAVRTSEFMSFLNVCATFGLLMLLAHQLVGTPAVLMKVWDYIMLAIMVPFRMLYRALSTVSLLGHIHSNVKHRDVWLRVIKGVIMALPILLIFGVLFSQADLAFSQFLKNFIDIEITERFMQRTVLLLFAFVAGLSFLSYIFFYKPVQPAVRQEQAGPSPDGRGIEALVFLGLIAALFLVFIGFQVTYLFGGEANIVGAGFTYAEYARRGFFELLAVAILSLLILFVSEKYSGSEIKRDIKFLAPALVLMAEVGIVMISAFKRLSLYVDAYGMTLDRFYVTVVIALLLVLFILLAIKFIKSKPEQFFTFGALLSVLSFLALVNIINPDAFVIKHNIEQFKRTNKIDVAYTQNLSADAVAGKIELYKMLEGQGKRTLQESLLQHRGRLEEVSQDWQSANLSRANALKLLQGIE
jgi:hypothetical protein